MAVYVDENTKVIVCGITGKQGMFHAEQMLNYNTKVVGGVTPGKGGTTVLGVPVFNSVKEAVKATGADVSLVFVPAPSAANSILESSDAGIRMSVCITEGIPIMDMMHVKSYLRDKPMILLGPNCPGLIMPGKCKIGIMPAAIHKPGRVGVVSRSGTLTYEMIKILSDNGIGQSGVVGIGGDPINGLSFTDVLAAFADDPETDSVVMIGEIGGTGEERAADWVKQNMKKPVYGFIGGKTAPPGRRMGHAGAIISGGQGTAGAKSAYLEKCGIPVRASLDAIASLLK